MKKRLMLVLALAFAIVLTACGGGNGGNDAGKPQVLNVYNWGDYIDMDVIKMFEEETGIKVNYETFATNEEMYAKVKAGGTSYDVLFPSDYMIEKMAKEDMLHTLDFSKIPNYKNIAPEFKKLAFDPEEKYSVPYFYGTVGIVYNTETITDKIDSWANLWEDKYAGKFTMVDSQRDVLMVALKLLGYSMNTHDLNQLNEAKELLIKQKPNVRAYVGDNVKDMLLTGEVDMALVWSGEAGTIIMEDSKFEYVLPKEGSNIWYDSIVIPKTAQNVEAAHKFIDFMSRPDVGLKNCEYVGYGTCNTETKKLVDPSQIPSTYAYPELEWVKDFEIFRDPGDFLIEYDKIWTEIKAN